MTIHSAPTRNSRNTLTILALCATMALGLTACFESNATDNAAGAPAMHQAPKVTVANPLKRSVTDSDIYTGRFDAAEIVDIRSRVNGYLQSVDFTEGALVSKGDKLMTIDPRPFDAIVQQRRADLNAAQSRIRLAKNTFDRTNALFQSGDISAQILDQRKSEYDEALASVAQAKAALSAAELDLSYTNIIAPISGRISRLLVSQGNLVNAGQDVLTTLVSIDPIYFYFDIDEQAYLKYARQGASEASDLTANIGLSDEDGFPHKGKIDFIDNRLSSNTGTLRGRAVVENADGFLTPGMFGRVNLSGSHHYDAILIPDLAISTDQSRKLVMVVGTDGVVTPRPVTLGPVIKGMRVIRTGLDGSELVVINGLQRAQPGAHVAPEITDLSDQFPQTQPDAINPIPAVEEQRQEVTE